jgi:putative flippase GtrA
MKLEREIFTFIVVGVASTVVDLLTYSFLIEFETNMDLAKTVSFVLGTTLGYLGNTKLTYPNRKTNLRKYVLVYTSSLMVNVWTNNLVYSYWFESELSWILATMASTLLNFLGLRFFAFAEKV